MEDCFSSLASVKITLASKRAENFVTCNLLDILETQKNLVR